MAVPLVVPSASAALCSGKRVPLRLLCPGSLRRRSDAGQWNVCRLSRLSPRTYLKDLAAAGATVGIALRSQQEARGGRELPERLSDCALAHKCRQSSALLPLPFPIALDVLLCLHRLPWDNHLCVCVRDAIFLVPAAPWACLYLNFSSAHTWNSHWECSARRAGASELRVDGAESDTSHKFLFCTPTGCRERDGKRDPTLPLPLSKRWQFKLNEIDSGLGQGLALGLSFCLCSYLTDQHYVCYVFDWSHRSVALSLGHTHTSFVYLISTVV